MNGMFTDWLERDQNRLNSMPAQKRIEEILADMQSILHGISADPFAPYLVIDVITIDTILDKCVHYKSNDLKLFIHNIHIVWNCSTKSYVSNPLFHKYYPTLNRLWAQIMNNLVNKLPESKQSFYRPDKSCIIQK